MSRRNLYLHLLDNLLISNCSQPINNFTKQISRSEWEDLTNANKRRYNRFAMTNNLPVYARTKNGNSQCPNDKK